MTHDPVQPAQPAQPAPEGDAVDELTPAEMALGFDDVLAEVRRRRDGLDRIPDGPRPRDPDAPKFKRRRFMVDWELQLSHLTVYLATVGLLLLGFTAYFFIFTFQLQRIRQLHEMRPYEDGPDVWFVATVVCVFVVLIAIGMAVFAIFQSHRIAGPAMRFRRAVGQMLRRDYDWHLQLRRRDYLQALADQVNALNQALKAKDLVISDAVLRLGELSRQAEPRLADPLRDLAAELGDTVLPPPAAPEARADGAPTGAA